MKMTKPLTKPFREETLHIPVGFICNNNCIFCMESRRTRYLERKDIPISFHKKSLSDSAGKFDRVVFTSGEPTTYEGLKELIAYAKDLKYKEIMLITNGRLLSNSDFLNSLVDKGLNMVSVSIHGHNAKLHESLTRSPGSFGQTIKALSNIKKMKESGAKLEFTMNMTLTRMNYMHLPEALKFFIYFNPRRIILNFFNPKGRAGDKAKLLMPKYSDIISAIKKIDPKINPPYVFIDFPACTTKEFLSHLGSIEDYHIRRPNQEITGDLWRDDLERGKSMNEKCKGCLLINKCHGFTETYLDLYGDKEIIPFKKLPKIL